MSRRWVDLSLFLELLFLGGKGFSFSIKTGVGAKKADSVVGNYGRWGRAFYREWSFGDARERGETWWLECWGVGRRSMAGGMNCGAC